MVHKLFNHHFVSQRGLENLRNYSYSGVDNSITARLFLNDFWNWTVSQVPTWVAPNVLTLCGGSFILFATMLCAYFAPTFTEPLPRWVILVTALMIFLYQTADNIDGKQAKRTKTGSPLGELFDHGVDSLVMGFVTMILGSLFQGGPLLTIFGAVFCMAPFYYSHWEEYHAGILIMGEFTGPTEMQHALVAVLLATAAFGTHIWLTVIPIFGGVQLNTLMLVFIAVFCLLYCYRYAKSVKYMTTFGTAVTNQSFREAVQQPIPYVIFTGLVLCWTLTTAETASKYPQLYLFATTMAFAVMTQRFIAQRICKEPFEPIYVVLVPFFLASANGIVKHLLMTLQSMILLFSFS